MRADCTSDVSSACVQVIQPVLLVLASGSQVPCNHTNTIKTAYPVTLTGHLILAAQEACHMVSTQHALHATNINYATQVPLQHCRPV